VAGIWAAARLEASSNTTSISRVSAARREMSQYILWGKRLNSPHAAVPNDVIPTGWPNSKVERLQEGSWARGTTRTQSPPQTRSTGPAEGKAPSKMEETLTEKMHDIEVLPRLIYFARAAAVEQECAVTYMRRAEADATPASCNIIVYLLGGRGTSAAAITCVERSEHRLGNRQPSDISRGLLQVASDFSDSLVAPPLRSNWTANREA